MNIEQSKSILKLLAATDNRSVDETTFGAWHIALEPYVYDLALEGAVLCMRDEKINRLIQPKDIIGKIAVIKDRLQANATRAKALEAEPNEPSVTQPVCFDHNLPIMRCDPCIRKTGKLSDQTGGTDSPRFHKEFFALIGRVVPQSKTQQNE